MDGVDEELRSTRGWLTSVGHGESSWFVRESWASWLSEFIRDGSITGAGNSLGSTVLGNISVGRSASRPTSTSSIGVRISGVWATELVHEVRNDTVEVKTIVKSGFNKIDEVAYLIRP